MSRQNPGSGRIVRTLVMALIVAPAFRLVQPFCGSTA
jgi:hypothetical protein